MLERLLIVLALAGAVALGWALLQLVQARRLRALAAQPLFSGMVAPDRPAVVAFTLPGCRECRALQAPALQRLAGELGGRVSITTLSAAEHSELAERLGLMTVPATVVLDARGVLRFLNQGFADEVRLKEQLGIA